MKKKLSKITTRIVVEEKVTELTELGYELFKTKKIVRMHGCKCKKTGKNKN